MRVKGKLIRKSLKTDTLSVAKLRLADMEKLKRQNAESLVDVTQGKLTFGEALKIYTQRVSGDVRVSTNTLNKFVATNGTACFSDPQWMNYPGCFYRLRLP